MSKVKKSKPELYELLYIISNDFTEEEAQKIHQKVKENLEKKKCEISYEEQWGKKKLAYPINHFKHGYYNLIEFQVEKSKLDEINYFLRLSDEVLRHQIIIRKYSNNDPRAQRKILDQNREEEQEQERAKIEAQEKTKAEAKLDNSKNEEQITPKEGALDKVSKKESEKDKQEEKEEEKEKVKDKKNLETTTKKEEKEKEAKNKDDGKVDLKDLDKKLDDILNTDDLV